jgi:hypothetical protein
VIIQREVDQSADTFDVLHFKVSPSQVIALKTFDFVGLSMSEVGTGVMLLSIIPPEATSLAASCALANNQWRAHIPLNRGHPTSAQPKGVPTSQLDGGSDSTSMHPSSSGCPLWG